MTELEPNDVCFLCSETNVEALEVHHIKPRRYNGSDEPENTVTLCGSCHNKIECLYDDAFFERLGVDVDQRPANEIDYCGGETVDPDESIDRLIPPSSPHIRVEEVDDLDTTGPKYRNRDGRSVSVADRSTSQTSANKLTESEHESSVVGNKSASTDYPTYYRLHCAYCHTVFTQHQHSDLARHLRIRHGVSDPYERKDTEMKFADSSSFGDSL